MVVGCTALLAAVAVLYWTGWLAARVSAVNREALEETAGIDTHGLGQAGGDGGGGGADVDGGSGGNGRGLTLVHFSAQLERFVWDRGCAWGLCSPCTGGVKGCLGCVGCFLESDTAQVEPRSERV